MKKTIFFLFLFLCTKIYSSNCKNIVFNLSSKKLAIEKKFSKKELKRLFRIYAELQTNSYSEKDNDREILKKLKSKKAKINLKFTAKLFEEVLLEEVQEKIAQIAKSYYRADSLIEYDELLQIARISALEAIRFYKPRNNNQLHSFIRVRMRKNFSDLYAEKALRLKATSFKAGNIPSVNVAKQLRHIRKAEIEASSRYQTLDPSFEQVYSIYLEADRKQYMKRKEAYNIFEYNKALLSAIESFSSDTKIYKDESGDFVDSLEIETSQKFSGINLEDEISNENFLLKVREIVKENLSYRRVNMINFYLDTLKNTDRPYSNLEKVANLYGFEVSSMKKILTQTFEALIRDLEEKIPDLRKQIRDL